MTSSVICYSTHAHGKCNLFVLYNKNLNDLLKDLGGMKKKNKSADVNLTSSACVCGQQPIKMHTEVTLLCN